MKNILVLCTGNSCRSQMAEAYLRHFADGKAAIYSAGIEAHGVNPYAIKVMQLDGIDMSSHTSNVIDDYLDLTFDSIITVCDKAKENCPFFPGKAERYHQNFPDPAKAKGTEKEILDEFISVRNRIKTFSKDFIKQLPAISEK